ncbi:unnamed protein product [Phaeothamnion confervicola]
MVEEEHGCPLYGIAFCDQGPQYDTYFASVGSNRATIYQTMSADVHPSINVAQAYVDEDDEEVFYACAWTTCGAEGGVLLAIAGFRGFVKLLRLARHEVAVTLPGHGNAVNDLRFHPVDPGLLFSASKDESVRLWNVRTRTCVAIFAGDRGHRDEVLSIDVHMLGHWLVSSGMDNTVKLWSLEGDTLQARVAESYTHPKPTSRRAFPTVCEQIPNFVTAKVHGNYVDCVRCVGDLILSKSTGDKVVLWRPDTRRGDDAVLVLREFCLADADIWFLRFGLDPDLRVLAAGNKVGKVLLWDVDGLGGERQRPLAQLAHARCGVTVRNIGFSADSRTLISGCDDGTLWRWDFEASG